MSAAPAPVLRLTKRAVQYFVCLARTGARRVCRLLLPEVAPLLSGRDDVGWRVLVSTCVDTSVGRCVRLSNPHRIHYSTIGDYTYLSYGASMSYTSVGKFCSIGPHFQCGWGIHPTEGISTSPLFYSTNNPFGLSLCKESPIQERKPIRIGNDVFIGMNVTVLDGVTIGNGAVVGAGCVVSKDVPPYAIVVGCPMRILRYRFSADIIRQLQVIAWWDWPADRLTEVAAQFADVPGFVARHAPASDERRAVR